MNEVPLEGGRTTSGVVRVDETVRRPIGGHSAFVHELLLQLEAREFPYAPKYLGLDTNGREILSFVAGDVPEDLGEFALNQIFKGGSILSALHDATSSMETLTASEEVICHGDASPCNYVFKETVPVCLIDFDAAFPGPKSIDYGYGSWLWSNLGSNDQDIATVSAKLEAYMLGYGEEPRTSLVAIGESQDRLRSKFLRENRSELQSAIDWIESCQRWLNSNYRELEARLTCS